MCNCTYVRPDHGTENAHMERGVKITPTVGEYTVMKVYSRATLIALKIMVLWLIVSMAIFRR